MEKLVCIDDFEKEAWKILDSNALNFYKGGADDEITLRENKKAFKRLIIHPRMLRDVSSRDLKTIILGKKVDFPVGISPIALQKMAHEDGEIASSRAAESMNTIFILSTVSTSSFSEITKANPNNKGRKWFQLYVFKERNQSINLIRRAEAAGFEALVITVDSPRLGNRRIAIQNKFHLQKHLRLANFDEGTDESNCLAKPKNGGSSLAVLDEFQDLSLTWDDIDWLKRVTTLPIIVKGILTGEDALLAVSHGVSAVFVSNHGGRQLDSVHATIDVLPEIVNAVKGNCEIYLDGGICTGTDIFKAIALGANMVFVGRPIIWGLVVGGEQGAKRVLEILRDEFDLTMSLAGVRDIQSITKNYVARHSSL